MRAALTALADELKRLKTEGVTSVAVSPESLAALKKVVAARAGAKAIVAEQPAPPATSAPARREADKPSEPATVARATSPSRSFSSESSAEKPAAKPVSTLPPPVPFTLPAGDKATRWAWLRDFVLSNPVCAANVRPGKKVVLGVGSLDAKIMFVGEAPGAEEEVRGEPFVGPAGQLLTKMILAMGVKREEVYIGNIMNWRPQLPTAPGAEQIGNREPTPEEMAFCLPFLKAQIEIVNPELVVALGATAAKGLLGHANVSSLGAVRGKWNQFSGKPVLVTYHPSYLLRQEASGPVAARKAKRATWEDLLKVMERAGLTITDKQRGYFLEK